MFVLVDNPDGDFGYISFVEENKFGEIYVCTDDNLESAIEFETEKDALDFKREWRLKAWVEEIK